ncbi:MULTISPECIES: TolC family protein [unclassified Simplicispira]|uniref:TolC family protein n=2 Tax=unclassified Simplicispira TaxID=2630407 RepID=UPI001F3BD12F|nr:MULTISPECIES: TolC family protein [unclassified Simplicispira]
MDFGTALQHMAASSDRLAASRQAVDSAAWQRRAVESLGGLSVSLTGAAYAYNVNLDVDLNPLSQALPGIASQLPPQLGGMVAQLPHLPASYTLNRHKTDVTASVNAVYPLYMGGIDNAARGLADARTREAQADNARVSDELASLLVQRYFGAQLADRAAVLRETALQSIEKHDAAAQKMLDAGVIAKVERLQARSALEDARKNARKARDDADLATTALTRTARAEERVQPTSPLFVNSQPVQPLDYFIDAALAHHPGLEKVAAKKAQASQLHAADEALRRPQVYAFGQRQIKSGNADWVAGIAVRWTLWDSIDRKALAASSQAQVEQAERTGAQARSDIALLVEKNWLALEQARRQYFAQQAGVDLSAEVLRLREAGLREGTSTTLDLIDAQLNNAKVQTERAQAAHDYVLALAALLESSGLSDEFANYMAQADVKVD